MALNLQQAADMLGVSPATVTRWARQGRLGMLRPSGEFRFAPEELEHWARNQGLRCKATGSSSSAPAAAEAGPLSQALARGAVLHEVPGVSPDEVLSNLVELIPLSEEVDRVALLGQLQAREHLAPTAMGHGIALPHPRVPSTDFVQEPTLVIAMLAMPVPWKALDGEMVRAALLLLNPTPQQHLQILSRVAHLLRQQPFLDALHHGAEAEAIRALVKSIEGSMDA